MLIYNTNNPSIKCNPSGEEGISQKNDTGDSKGEKKGLIQGWMKLSGGNKLGSSELKNLQPSERTRAR